MFYLKNNNLRKLQVWKCVPKILQMLFLTTVVPLVEQLFFLRCKMWGSSLLLKPTEGRKCLREKTWASAKNQLHEAGNFRALWGFLFIAIPLGLKKNISREIVAEWNNYTCHPTCHAPKSVIKHSKPWKRKWHKHPGGSCLPDVLPLLQYWQTDGAFFFCVFFICPFFFVLLNKQLSLFGEDIWKVDFWCSASIRKAVSAESSHIINNPIIPVSFSHIKQLNLNTV